jgi:hypothetical protein
MAQCGANRFAFFASLTDFAPPCGHSIFYQSEIPG